MRRALEKHRKPVVTNTERSGLIAWLESWRVYRTLRGYWPMPPSEPAVLVR
jgi:hypothetical protein